jgi:hypothetical protein
MNAIPRQGYSAGSIGGGIIQGIPMGSRTGYGIFSKLKSGVKKFLDPAIDVVTNVAKSPVGKAALLGAGLYGLGGGFGSQGFGLGNIGPSIGRGLSAVKSGLFGSVMPNVRAAGMPSFLGETGFTRTGGLLGKLGLTKGGGSMMPTALGGMTAAGLLTYFMAKGKTEEEAENLAQDVYRGKGLGMDLIKSDMQKYRSGILSASQAHDMGYHFLTPRNYLGAQGGRVGLKKGTKGKGPHGKTDKEVLKELYPTLFSDTTTSIEGSPKKKKHTKGKKDGGRIGYQEGSGSSPGILDVLKNVMDKNTWLEFIDLMSGNKWDLYKDPTEWGKLVGEEKAQGGRIGKYGGGMGTAMPRIPTGMPRVNAGGITELDYRQEGGFVPMGVKEKADDVPAMLSKNEFVMTADAVKGAGGGDVEKGAQRMYDTMKQLEGRVA